MELKKSPLDIAIDKMYRTHEGFEKTISKADYKKASIEFQDQIKRNIEEASRISATKQDAN